MTVLMERRYAEEFRDTARKNLDRIKQIREQVAQQWPTPDEFQRGYLEELDDTIERNELAQAGQDYRR